MTCPTTAVFTLLPEIFSLFFQSGLPLPLPSQYISVFEDSQSLSCKFEKRSFFQVASLGVELESNKPESKPWPVKPESKPWPVKPESIPWPVKPESNPWPVKLELNPWPVKPESKPWPVKPESNPWPDKPESNPWPVKLESNPWPDKPESNPWPVKPGSNPSPLPRFSVQCVISQTDQPRPPVKVRSGKTTQLSSVRAYLSSL